MEVLSVSSNHEIWWSMLGFLIIAVFLIIGIFDGRDKKSKIQMTTCAILSALTLILGIALCIHESGKKTLKVIISDMDKVDFDTYKIINNEGMIIELKEK